MDSELLLQNKGVMFEGVFSAHFFLQLISEVVCPLWPAQHCVHKLLSYARDKA